MLTLTDILNQLNARQLNPNQWLACCPAHTDERASLSIGIGDNGQILLFCHAGCSFDEVLNALGGNAVSYSPRQSLQRPEAPPPNCDWQDQALTQIQRCKAALKSPGVDYLHNRGIKPVAYFHFQVGYNSRDEWFAPDQWGIDGGNKIYLAEGIVIPIVAGGAIYGIKVRRLSKPIKWDTQEWSKNRDWRFDGPRKPDGCSSIALLGADNITPDKPILLVSGEMDLLTAYGEIRDLITPVTFCGENKGIPPQKWLNYFKRGTTFVCYDNDDTGRQKAADFAKLGLIPIFTPKHKDINEFYVNGGNLRVWIQYHLKQHAKLIESKPEVQPITQHAETEAIFSQPLPEVQPKPAPVAEPEPEIQPETPPIMEVQAPVESFPILDTWKYGEWLDSSGLELDQAAPLKWVKHPDKPGQFVVALGVKNSNT